MSSLGFGDHSRDDFREEGGFDLVLERRVLGKEGKRKGGPSILESSMGKFVTMMWGRDSGTRRRTDQSPSSRKRYKKWWEIEDVLIGDRRSCDAIKFRKRYLLCF